MYDFMKPYIASYLKLFIIDLMFSFSLKSMPIICIISLNYILCIICLTISLIILLFLNEFVLLLKPQRALRTEKSFRPNWSIKDKVSNLKCFTNRPFYI